MKRIENAGKMVNRRGSEAGKKYISAATAAFCYS